MTLRLLLNWPKWIHRRTETVALTDPETIRRRVAVDFTLFADLPPLITDGAGARQTVGRQVVGMTRHVAGPAVATTAPPAAAAAGGVR